MKKKQYSHDFLNDIIAQVKNIPVEDIVGSVVELVPQGRYLMGLCPFHPDKHIGSFVVTPQMGLWRCFTENIGGNGISFEMQYYNLGFLDAVFRLALDYGIIDKETFDSCSNKRYDSVIVRKLQESAEKQDREKPKKADDAFIGKIYGFLPICCPLSNDHKKHLDVERKLTDTSDFFTFPTRKMNLPEKLFSMYMQSVDEECKDAGMSEWQKENVSKYFWSQIAITPGFYVDKDGKVDFVSYKGIGFLVRNERGIPVGIQIRRDVVKETKDKKEARYVWFSSAFAMYDESSTGGAASGSPGGVIYPNGASIDDVGNAAICVTEGRFKAEKIAEKGNVGIYISGVSSWKNVMQSIFAMPRSNKPIYLMFDADMMGNVAVHKQMSALANALESNDYSVRLIVWPKGQGKGFDDLVNNTGRDYIKYLKVVSLDSFEDQYEEVLGKLLDGQSYKDIEDPDKFSENLQEEVEKVLQLASA